MGLLDAVKKVLGRALAPGETGHRHPAARREAQVADLHVPEVTSAELMQEMNGDEGQPFLLVDCRENYERAQGVIPDSLHIPMNSIPARLGELDPAQEIVVYCAHGNRSFGVAGWLIQQGYRARSLKGGIVAWQHAHGPVASAYRGGS